MTFDPFSTPPMAPSDKSPVPAQATPPAQNPFGSAEEDEDEIHFDLTGEGNLPMAQATPVMAEPELRVELTPMATPSSVSTPTPAFSAPWEMPTPAAPAAEPTNPFSLDLSATPAPTPQTPAPAAPAGAGLVGLFDRLVNMIEEETRAFETSQKKHQANIANEQRLIEEETKAFGQKKADILKGIEDLKKRLAA